MILTCTVCIVNIHIKIPLVSDECFTALSTTTIQFTRSYLTFCNDCMKVYMQELHVFVTGALVKILKAQLHHAEQSAKSQKFSKEVRSYLDFFGCSARLERGKIEKKQDCIQVGCVPLALGRIP